MPNIGPMEIVLILVVALLVLGPKRLPEVARSAGKGMREFKEALTNPSHDDDEDDDDEEDEPEALPADAAGNKQ